MDPFYRHQSTGWVNLSQMVVSHIPLVQSFRTRVLQNIVWGSARNGVINRVEISRKIPHTFANIADFFLYGNW